MPNFHLEKRRATDNRFSIIEKKWRVSIHFREKEQNAVVIIHHEQVGNWCITLNQHTVDGYLISVLMSITDMNMFLTLVTLCWEIQWGPIEVELSYNMSMICDGSGQTLFCFMESNDFCARFTTKWYT